MGCFLSVRLHGEDLAFVICRFDRGTTMAPLLVP